MAGWPLPFCGGDRGVLLWGNVCHHVKREASRLHHIYAPVYRVLGKTGPLKPWNVTPSQKGTRFVQPLEPHQHWHTDISYLNICGTFYYL